MKNTFARGGIEFLAVLLGLSGSLSIDSIVKEKDQKEQNTKILKRLYDNLVADSSDGSWNVRAYERGIIGSENVIKWCDSNPTIQSINNDFEKERRYRRDYILGNFNFPLVDRKYAISH